MRQKRPTSICATPSFPRVESNRQMLDRLLGLETEYAIRYTPATATVNRARNDVIYEAFRGAIGQLVLSRPGRLSSKQQFFVENGGEVSYEELPYAPDGGLLEGATPECRGPSQLLLYQRAQDHLLIRAIPGARALLAAQGYTGELGLLKNCRDAEDHVYGAQENYEVELARGPGLMLWRAGLILGLPLVVLSAALTWALTFAVSVMGMLMLLGIGVASVVSRRVRDSRLYRALFVDTRLVERSLGHWLYWLERIIWEPALTPFLLLCRALAFRRVRRDVLAFLLTRSLITGAGTLRSDGSFGLSEKGPFMRRIVRRSLAPADRSIFELGNLCKDLVDPIWLRGRRYARLFRRRQRMQLGLSDSNMAQVAEYLKVAVTTLVIDMAEAGALAGLPRLRRPLAALRAIVADPSLQVRVEVMGGEPMRALDVQQAYLERARQFVQRAHTASLEAAEIIKLWAETLEMLGRDPERLIGRIDWITKKQLLEQAGSEAPYEVQKKIDLKYHELDVGYFAALESRGLAVCLVSGAELERALHESPEDSPAQIRSLIIRNLGRADEKVRVSWDEIRVGGRMRGTVIRLDDYRDR